MNSFFRWPAALISGAIIAYAIWTKEDTDAEIDKPLHRKYGPVISPGLLMELFLFVFIVAAFQTDAGYFLDSLLPLFSGIFISMGIFFALFILLLPVFRKYVSAKTVALIWLLPNLLYITLYSYMALDKPGFVLDVGNIPLRKISLIWIAAAAAVFAVYLVRHFAFRFKLLRRAKPVEDGLVRSLWETMQTEYEFKKPCIKIVTSDNTATPLSIGLFRHTTVLVLPHTDYSAEELKLIFKHELIHIIRSDSQIKLFIAFCNAICWFNPLMWIAMRKCSEDLELSCDEYVIEGCSKREKDLYGDLILSVAGNGAGFTTCLSSDAGALKYRLTNIYRPGRRFGGSIIAGIIVAAMLLGSGYVSLSYNHRTVEDVFSKNVKEANIDIGSLMLGEGNTLISCSCSDADALSSYIMELKVCEVAGNYNDKSNEGRSLYCHYQTDEGRVVLCIEEDVLKYWPSYESGRREKRKYYLDEPADWDYIMSICYAERQYP